MVASVAQELVADMYVEGSWGIRLDFNATLFQVEESYMIKADWREKG